MTDAQGAQTALDKLIEAVEAGKWDQSAAWRSLGIDQTGRAERAYHGSLDAALALHEALLPGTLWKFTPLGRCVVMDRVFNKLGDSEYSASTPARAWLIAILRAYRSVQS